MTNFGRSGSRLRSVNFRKPTEDPIWLKALLGGLAIGFIAVLLLLPLVLVFKEALAHGLSAFWAAMTEPDSLAAVRLSLTAAAIAVPLNTVFGIAAAWSIAKFDFPGKTFLVTLIDLPFSSGFFVPSINSTSQRYRRAASSE